MTDTSTQPVWNVVVRVLAPRQDVGDGPAAIDAVTAAITRAGFGLMDAPDYSSALDNGDGTWHVLVTAVALRRAPHGARARTELADALQAAGFATQAPRPGDAFESEPGVEPTQLPGETALTRVAQPDTRRITAARLQPAPDILPGVPSGHIVVTATLEDGTEVELFRYFTDELSFTEAEFRGLTVQEARDLFTRRDIEYLRS
jgi:hypothetical protein